MRPDFPVATGRGPVVALLAAVALTAAAGLATRSDATFAGRNGLVSFSSSRSGGGDIYAVRADGRAERRIIGLPGRDAQSAWSPDGRRIAFRRGPEGRSHVFVAAANGSNPRALTSGTGFYASQPSWSPDGRKLLFRSNRDGDPDVWIMNADGSGQRRLLDSPGDERYPIFSVDGRRVVFRSDRDGDPEIYSMELDGTGLSRLTDNTLFDSAPSFSPDGRLIVFERVIAGNTDVYVMRSNGTGVRKLTDSPVLDEGPVFSPDGRRIAFTSERDGNSEIYVMNADGSGERDISNNPAKEESPDWQPLPVRASIRLAVSPPRATVGQTVRVRFRATAVVRGRARSLRGAKIRFAGARASTAMGGRASIVKRFRRAGLFVARATKPGFRSGVARVRVSAGP